MRQILKGVFSTYCIKNKRKIKQKLKFNSLQIVKTVVTWTGGRKAQVGRVSREIKKGKNGSNSIDFFLEDFHV